MSPPILVIQNGKYAGRKVKISQSETIIGRGEEAKIRIASAEVSREHCLLILKDDGILVRDLGSRNGTYVDGKPANPESLLRPGGTLSVGPMTFQFAGEHPSVEHIVVEPVEALPPQPETEGLSEDDVANMLSDINLVNTTVVGVDSDSSPGGESRSAPPKRQFHSVAEEAEDIIQRYHESLAATANKA